MALTATWRAVSDGNDWSLGQDYRVSDGLEGRWFSMPHARRVNTSKACM